MELTIGSADEARTFWQFLNVETLTGKRNRLEEINAGLAVIKADFFCLFHFNGDLRRHSW
jgi:hypothetical protein